MRVKRDFVLREIAGDYIVIPTGKTVLEFNGLITINDIGVSLWEMLQQEVTMEQLVEGICGEYDVEADVARQDIQEFVDRMVESGILETDETGAELTRSNGTFSNSWK